MQETAMVLSIGSIVGGSTLTNRRWRESIADPTRAVADARADIESPLNVNVVFQVPGELLEPDFEGVRTGRYSRSAKLLLVQVALPIEVPPDPDTYLCAALLEAISEAEAWAKRRRIAPDLGVLRELAAGV